MTPTHAPSGALVSCLVHISDTENSITGNRPAGPARPPNTRASPLFARD